jgi:hypothetical protein
MEGLHKLIEKEPETNPPVEVNPPVTPPLIEDIETPEEDIELEGEEIEVDSDGNNEDGNEIEAGGEGEEDDVSSFFASISSLTGVEVEGEFDLTAEGIANREIASNKIAVNNAIKSINDNYPEIGKILEVAAQGGNYKDVLKSYGETQSAPLANIDLSEDDVDTQKTVLRKIFEDKGIGGIDAILKGYEDQGMLYEEAVNQLTNYKKIVKSKADQVAQEQLNAKRESDRIANEKWASVRQSITSGNLSKGIIPKNDRDELEKFIHSNLTVTDDNELIVPISLSDEKALEVLYYMQKGGDLSQLIKKKTKSALEESLNKQKAQKKALSKVNNAKPKGGFEGLAFFNNFNS